VIDDPVADPDRAGADLLEPGEHAQHRGLAAAGRADQDHELSVVDFEIEVRYSDAAVRVGLAHPLERDLGHGGNLRTRERGLYNEPFPKDSQRPGHAQVAATLTAAGRATSLRRSDEDAEVLRPRMPAAFARQRAFTAVVPTAASLVAQLEERDGCAADAAGHVVHAPLIGTRCRVPLGAAHMFGQFPPDFAAFILYVACDSFGGLAFEPPVAA
jgi:hypothetical protein